MAFQAQLYADLNEFKSLANLVGPYGIKLIEREVLKFILSGVNGIKVNFLRILFETHNLRL